MCQTFNIIIIQMYVKSDQGITLFIDSVVKVILWYVALNAFINMHIIHYT